MTAKFIRSVPAVLATLLLASATARAEGAGNAAVNVAEGIVGGIKEANPPGRNGTVEVDDKGYARGRYTDGGTRFVPIEPKFVGTN